MARKGQFKKGGGRVGGRTRRKASTRALTRYKTRTVVRTRNVHSRAKVRRRRRGGGRHGGAMKLTHIALATAGLAFVTNAASGGIGTKVNEVMAKVPGTKTFGATAMLGIGALAFDRFIKPNKWLRLLGTAGVVLAAAKVGEQGPGFKFLGDGDDVGDFDLADAEDDLGDDDIGDDD